MDHVIPLSKGGPHTADNCRTAHWTCNAKKHVSERVVKSVSKGTEGSPAEQKSRAIGGLASCSMVGCPRPAVSGGWCGPHGVRNRKYGDPLYMKCGCGCGQISTVSPDFFGIYYRPGHGLSGIALTDKEKLSQNCVAAPVSEYGFEKYGLKDDCQIWTGAVNHQGYGRVYLSVNGIKRKGRSVLAHRLAYELEYGAEALRGLTVDHLCYRPLCCNPNHLEAVTAQENVRRASERVTRCPRGHLYDEENVDFNERGHRRCRQCNTDRYHVTVLGHSFEADLSADGAKRRSCKICNRRKAAETAVCPSGHEYTPANTRIGSDGKRYCIQCSLDRTHFPNYGHSFVVDEERSSPKRRRCRVCAEAKPKVTHCAHGHEFNSLTIEYSAQGHRRCALCRLDLGHKEKTGHQYEIEWVSDGVRGCAKCRTKKKSEPQFCPAGHEFTEENTFYKNGWRNCRQCNFNRQHRGRTGHDFIADPTFGGTKIRRCAICYRKRVNGGV